MNFKMRFILTALSLFFSIPTQAHAQNVFCAYREAGHIQGQIQHASAHCSQPTSILIFFWPCDDFQKDATKISSLKTYSLLNLEPTRWFLRFLQNIFNINL